MPVHVSSTCAHHQEVKIALHSLWYHHTYRWQSRARDGHIIFHTYCFSTATVLTRTLNNVTFCLQWDRGSTVVKALC